MADLKAEEYKTFESIKRIREDGTEFWCARELAPVLDYAKWENFSKDPQGNACLQEQWC